MSKRLLEPILMGGIRNNYFFNGRLLSAEDLRDEQAANSEGRRRLGQAIGDGVVYGLYVSETIGTSSKSAPVITVEPGLCVNRRGVALALTEATDVSLVRPVPPGATPSSSATFQDCQPLATSVYVAGEGVYLLTIGPSSGKEGRAPVSGLGNSDGACNSHYTIEGVQFRLIPLDFTAAELSDHARLRNLVAYKCYGVADMQSFFRNPFGPVVEGYGLLDDLRSTLLTDCEVPLAVLHWTAQGGINFIDEWAVRRPVTEQPVADKWPLLFGARRVSETEAMCLQFQDQIEEITLKETSLDSIVAAARFKYLPPVGLLPIKGTGSPNGFNPQKFFGDRASKEIATTDGNLLRALLHEALHHDPIELSAPEKIQLYVIWENLQAVEGLLTTQLALVFASHTLPYRGVARYGYGRWDISRFASSVI
jgi:hypothetical protein